ncbi:helix-turn-helix domain-containing protein [Bradyrhizobium sp.]|uniref:helix-turn-helix domain-containing protein n=1 Tax=Bradyrhizobium sp. TaxID=376 RepID=UPI003C47A760
MSDLVDRLRGRIEELETLLGVDNSTTGRIREALRLDVTLATILGMLLVREFVSRDGLYTVLYGDRPECDMPDPKGLDVLICKLRARLKPAGIQIKTRWADGWSIPDKAKLRALINAPASAPSISAQRRAFMEA